MGQARSPRRGHVAGSQTLWAAAQPEDTPWARHGRNLTRTSGWQVLGLQPSHSLGFDCLKMTTSVCSMQSALIFRVCIWVPCARGSPLAGESPASCPSGVLRCGVPRALGTAAPGAPTPGLPASRWPGDGARGRQVPPRPSAQVARVRWPRARPGDVSDARSHGPFLDDLPPHASARRGRPPHPPAPVPRRQPSRPGPDPSPQDPDAEHQAAREGLAFPRASVAVGPSGWRGAGVPLLPSKPDCIVTWGDGRVWGSGRPHVCGQSRTSASEASVVAPASICCTRRAASRPRPRGGTRGDLQADAANREPRSPAAAAGPQPAVVLGALARDGAHVLPPAPHRPRPGRHSASARQMSLALPGPAPLPTWQQPQPLSLLD